MSRVTGRSTLAVAVIPLLLAAACSKPAPPDKDQPPEPQAAEQHTQLRDAIQAPIDRAKAVDPAVQDAAQKQREQIDAQTGG